MRLNSGNARNAAAPCLRIRFAQPAVIIGADRCLVLAHKIGSADLQFAMFCIIAAQLSLRKESQRKAAIGGPEARARSFRFALAWR